MLPKIEAIQKLLPVVEAPSLLTSIGTSKQEAIAKITQSALGQQLQAEILAKLPNGQFLIKVVDTKLAVSLPNLKNAPNASNLPTSPNTSNTSSISNTSTSFQVGEKLNLSLVSVSPKLVFLLDGQNRIPVTDKALQQSILQQLSYQAKTQSAAVSLAPYQNENVKANPYQKNALQYSQADISDTAKMISQILSTSPQTKASPDLLTKTLLNNGPTATTTAADINPAAEKLAEALSPQLNRQISSSGLFYESHVAAWLNGQFAKQDLLQEPQSKVPLFTDVSKLSEAQNPHREILAQLIHQQLDTSEQQKIAWQGYFFPNAPMEWTIQEERTHNKNAFSQKEEEKTTWNSALKVDLPELGAINIQMSMHNNQLSLTIATQDADTANLLQAQQFTLKESIHNAGTTIQTFSVAHDKDKFNES